MPAARARGETLSRPRSDAYDGLLGLSLLALITAIVFAYLNWDQIKEKPKAVNMPAARAPATPGPSTTAPGAAGPGGAAPGAVPPGGGAQAPAPPAGNPAPPTPPQNKQ